MLLIRTVGLLLLLLGLLLVGVSGDNHRVPNGRRITYGASLMAFGAVAAVFASKFETWIPWAPF